MLRGKTPQMERIGNLRPSDGLQLTTDVNVGESFEGRGFSLESFNASALVSTCQISSSIWPMPHLKSANGFTGLC